MTYTDDRSRASPHAEFRRHPQVIETMLDDLEDKVRHYFLLYVKERKRRQKCEKFSYWMQQEMATNRRLLMESQSYAESLEAKIEEIRGDPEALRDTVQRVDLMYAQIDTLIQAFAGVCSFVATKEADRPTILQCVLDYLYPCRALDPRLNALYGALYYYRLGEYKGMPEQPPPPPEPKFMPLHEIMGPWIQPSPYTPTPTPPVHATKFDAALAATLEAAKAAEGAKADVQQTAKKTTVEIQKPKEARLLATKTATGTGVAKAASTEPRAKASLPKQAEDASADVELTGMSILLEELSAFKRPSLSRGVGARLVVRFDSESPMETKKKPERCVIVDKCDGTPGSESATVYFLASLSPLPAKKPGVVPKICIDIYDEKSPTGLGSAQKTIMDADTLKKSAPWQIKDSKGSVLGQITVSVAPIPLNAMLPAQVKQGDAATKTAKAGEASKSVVAKSGGTVTKPELPKPSAAVSKPALPKVGGAKPELPKPSAPASKPELPKAGSPASKPDLPKPAVPATKPELPKAELSSKSEITKPGLPAKPDLSKPVLGAKPDLPKPKVGAKPELPKPALGAKPELPKPGGVGAKPDPPKPGAADAKKTEPPKPGAPLGKTEGTKAAEPPKPGLPKPGAAAEKPGPPKPPEAAPGATGKVTGAKADLSKPGLPNPKSASPSAGPAGKLGPPKPADESPGPKGTPAAPTKAGDPTAKDAKAGGPVAPPGKDAKLPSVPPANGKPALPAKGPLSAKPAVEPPGVKADAKKALPSKAGETPKPVLGAKPDLAKPLLPKPGLAKPELGAKPAVAKPTLAAKPVMAKPDLAKPVLPAKPAEAKPALAAKPGLAKPGLAKPVIPAKPMLALAKGAPTAKPALGAKPALAPKPGLSKPGLPPAKNGIGKAA
ncbi:hypothetical protein, conserved [Eimeria necatrix]|uniref:Variable surface lipoprotein n=1 Tax=Eimeria necatrix TaxID=51315 RepID=U6N651_9EIME|nr:hypothetical protein, conserved [Eimeria necatrix]CDJ70160.1 hypothetical protein, conserved [Eimeria necatrix]